MDALDLLNNLGAIVEAPSGMERLRRFILALAVQGRLVPQHSVDEPANCLLARIESEREHLISEQLLRRQSVRRRVDLAVPDGWASVDLGAVVDLEYGQALPAKSRTSDGVIPVYGSNGIVGYHNSAYVESACLIVGRKGSAGAVNISSGACWPIDTTYFVRPRGGMSTKFTAILLLASGLDQMDRSTAVPGLNREDAYRIPIGLPPLAEQERIAAKVDELVLLGDQFALARNRRSRATFAFRASALHALTTADSAAELGTAWDRVSSRWPDLYNDSESVRQLRQTILQLAITGKLVAQNPGDESASQLLIRIGSCQHNASKRGVDAPKPRSTGHSATEPFALPEGWAWARVEDICTHIVDCLHRTPVYSTVGLPAIRTCDIEPGRILVNQALRVDEETFQQQSSRLTVEAGDVLYSREGGRYGIAAVVPPDTRLCLSQRMMQFRCAAPISSEFLAWFLNSPLGLDQAHAAVGGSASPHLNIGSIRRFLMPLPPADEQRLIVERISALMELCDRLDNACLVVRRQADRLAAASCEASRAPKATRSTSTLNKANV